MGSGMKHPLAAEWDGQLSSTFWQLMLVEQLISVAASAPAEA